MATNPLERAACPKCRSTPAVATFRLLSGATANHCPCCDHAWDALRAAPDPHGRGPHDDSELIAQIEALIASFDRMTEAAVRLAIEADERLETKRGTHLRLVPRKIARS